MMILDSGLLFWGHPVEMNVLYCVLFSSRDTVSVRIRFGVWSVSADAHAFVLISVVIVAMPKWMLQLKLNWYKMRVNIAIHT